MIQPELSIIPGLTDMDRSRPRVLVTLAEPPYRMRLKFEWWDAEHVKRLKATVGYTEREWDVSDKTWRIKIVAWDAFYKAFEFWLSIDYDVWTFLCSEDEPQPAKGFVPSPRHIPEKRYSKVVR